jgi:hypothetical protein
MTLLSRIRTLIEDTGKLYTSKGTGYSARVISKNNKHVTKFFKDGVHMKDADYDGQNEKDAHDFAKEEMEYRSKEKNESTQIDELSNNTLQAHSKARYKQARELGTGINSPNKEEAREKEASANKSKYRHTNDSDKVTPNKSVPRKLTDAEKETLDKRKQDEIDDLNNKGYNVKGRYMADSVETEQVDPLAEERRPPPEGYKESGDPIKDASKRQTGRDYHPRNKMMGKQGNEGSIKVIADILAGK